VTDAITSAIEGAIAASTPEPEAVVETATEETPTSDTATEEPEAAAEEPAAEPAVKAENAETGETKPKVKRGPIPYDRHEAVLTKARREAEAKLAEKQARIDALAKYESEDHQAQIKFLHLLETQPDRAVAILRQVDPERFGKLTWAEQQAAAQAVAQEVKKEVAEKPQPDSILPDGSPGYSAEAAERLLQWQLAQERKAYDEKFKALEDRLAPIQSEREAREAYSQSLTKMSKVLADARSSWPGFTDHEPAIRKALEDNPTWDSFKSDTEKIRAEERRKLLEEMNAKGKAAGSQVVPGGLPAAAAKASNEPRDLTDVIKDSIRSIQ
jgi:hypothetical protein